MSGLSDLYQEILLEHNSKPRNFRKVDEANQTSEGYNPLCGDQITLYLKVVDGVIDDVGFQGSGLRHIPSLGFHDDPEHQGSEHRESPRRSSMPSTT